MAKQTTTRTTRSGRTTERDRDDASDRRLREDVQEVWESSRDVWDGSCRMLSSLVIGIGEALAPPSYSRRRVEREYEDGDERVQTTTETTTRRQESASAG